MFTPPIGCPCQPQLLCAADQRHIIDPACEFPAHNDPVYSIDGGAGAIISHGLLEKLNEQQVPSLSLIFDDHLLSFRVSDGCAISPFCHGLSER